ncbi:hypothetical protein CAC42_4855 [Sphaceloma murrayae]|uniref:Uncharacterized protein n=1 Tax=Sphaceloma murrayae TaxID=2082308 RepID=A0A2K1QPF1_9PEZI|nr:hypothetical protein CAC42_4855 [Sphaceloma murrayae]
MVPRSSIQTSSGQINEDVNHAPRRRVRVHDLHRCKDEVLRLRDELSHSQENARFARNALASSNDEVQMLKYKLARCEESIGDYQARLTSFNEHAIDLALCLNSAVEKANAEAAAVVSLQSTEAHLTAEVTSLRQSKDQLHCAHHATTQQLESTQAQMLALKQSLSSTLDRSNFRTDEDIKRELDDLFHDIQSWALSALRALKWDDGMKVADELHWIRESLPFYSESGQYQGGAKKYMVSILMFSTIAPVVKMHEDHLTFQLCASEQPGLAGCLSQARPENVTFADWKAWLVTTKDMILAAQPTFIEQCETAAVHVFQKETDDMIATINATPFGPNLRRSLGRIYSRAFRLLVTLHFHPADYRLAIPSAWDRAASCLHRFNYNKEEVVGQDQPIDDPTAHLAASFFPALVKARNEQGEKIEETIVSKAKVLIQTIETVSNGDGASSSSDL